MSLGIKVETVRGKERLVGHALLVTRQKGRGKYRCQKTQLLTLGAPLILNASFLYRGPWHGHIFK
jgi:hypothetical protein